MSSVIIPIIIGVTCTDMIPIVMEALTKSYVKRITKYNKCYVYNFNRNLPGDDFGAWHSCDLLYAFKTLKNNWRPFEEIDYKISHEIFSAFSSSSTPTLDTSITTVTMIWKYIGEVIFNM